MKTKLFIHAFILLCIVGILNIIGTVKYLFWTTNYYDSILHFLGGATVALTMILFWQYRHMHISIQNISRGHMLKIGISSALVIGVAWEIYELAFGITHISDGIRYVTDSSSDLLMDIVGGIAGSLYARGLIRK